MVRALADLGPAAVWLGGAVIGLMAVFTGYVGLVLVAALKADTPELRKYRFGLLRELLRFMRELFRGWGKR
jgi:hypothetical protein